MSGEPERCQENQSVVRRTCHGLGCNMRASAAEEALRRDGEERGAFRKRKRELVACGFTPLQQRENSEWWEVASSCKLDAARQNDLRQVLGRVHRGFRRRLHHCQQAVQIHPGTRALQVLLQGPGR
jgi:hypothetical protein